MTRRSSLPGWLVGSLLAAACAPAPGEEPSLATEQTAGALRGLAGPPTPWRRPGLQSMFVVLEGAPAAEALGGEAPGEPAARVRAARQLEAIRAQHARVRPAIEAAGAVIDAELLRLGNAFQVRVDPARVDELARIAEVAYVEPAPVFQRSLGSAVPTTGAPAAWSSPAHIQGDGVVIGIIDSGIDYLHADLGGSGAVEDFEGNDPTLVEEGSFPTARVVGGHDFVGDDYDPEEVATPSPDADPVDCRRGESQQIQGGHGTHVAGIAAGNGVLADGTPFLGPYEQSFDPGLFRVSPGIAPRASLYALKVFGCSGGTTFLAAALERAVDPNDDGDMSDRLDVVNASLGASYGASRSALTRQVVDNLIAAGSVFVAAAGNDGGSFYVTGAPALYPPALSVAASADNELIVLEVDGPASVAGNVPASEGAFTTKLATTGPVGGALVASLPADACATLQNPAALAGNVALIDRGDCSFVSKFQRAVAAGAVAAVIVDNEVDDTLLTMGGGDPDEIAIPGVLIRRVDGEALRAALSEGVTVTLSTTRFEGLGAEQYAPFSSRGPSSVDSALKPELSAPGFAIDSAQVGSGTEPRRSQGTSMASPVVAGAAALVRQAQPSLTPQQVKAALINSAAPLRDAGGTPYPVSLVGSGRVDVARAIDTAVVAGLDTDDGTVAVSFGALVSAEPVSATRRVRVDNRTDADAHYQLEAAFTHPRVGLSLTLSEQQVTVPAGGRMVFDATLGVDPAALDATAPDPQTATTQFDNGRHFLVEAAGHITLTSASGPGLRVPFYGIARPAAEQSATAPVGCSTAGDAGDELRIPVSGPSAHPAPVVTAYQLGTTHPENAQATTDEERALDIVVVGAASSAATAASFEDASLSFGVGVAGEWTTPAQGPFSPVGVLIDTDRNGVADFAVFAEPLSREGPYADVLVSTTYSLTTGEQLPTKRFLNIVPASTFDTAPFHNSVVALSVNLAELGVTEGDAWLAYAAFSQSLRTGGIVEQTAWVTFNAGRPTLDTSLGSAVEGRPVFGPGEPITVRIDREAALLTPPSQSPTERTEADGALPQLLLLHHNNGRGRRWEVVDAVSTAHETLALLDGGDRGAVGEALGRDVTVQNGGEGAVDGMVFEASASGGVLTRVYTDRGSPCVLDDASVRCELGSLGPGEQARVRLEVEAGDEAPVVQATATLASGCQTALELSFELPEPAAQADPLVVSGGCGCRTATRDPAGAAWPAAFALLLALTRRRRTLP